MEAIIGIIMLIFLIYSLKRIFKIEKKIPNQHKIIQETQKKPRAIYSTVRDGDRLTVAKKMSSFSASSKSGKKQTGRNRRKLLKQGMIMKEILDEPRAKKPFRNRFYR